MKPEAYIIELESEIKTLKEELKLLKQSEHLFEALFEQAGGYSMILDPNTEDGIPIIIAANQAACRYHGYEKSDFIGQPVAIVDDEEGKKKVKKHTEIIMTGKPFHIENKHMRKDGSLFHVSVNAQRIDLPEGPSVILTTEYDITERVLAKQALYESEQRFRMAINELPFPAMIHDDTGKVYFVNHRWTELTGYTYEEIDTIPKWIHLAYSDRSENAIKAIDKIFQYDDFRNISEEYKIQTKDGKYIYWQFYTSLVSRNQDGRTIILSTAIDRTEVTKLQKELNQSEKLRAIGQLAGGIAHDFNNMLGVIIGYSEMALLEADESCNIHSYLAEIMKAAEHSAALTKQLLTFARKQPIKPSLIMLNSFIKKYADLVKKLLGEQIELHLNLMDNIPPIYIDETQLTQILTNLCVNARDAMQNTSEKFLLIKTCTRSIDSKFCEIYPDGIPGDFVCLTIKDTGCGMDTETLQKIAEPFFTTKGYAKGTGMGFSTVYGIIKQNKGFIFIDSVIDEGTLIDVYFPISEGILQENTTYDLAYDKRNSDWTILFVEDEPALLQLGEIMLKELGYKTITTSSAFEALQIVRNNQIHIDLVITDVIMPEMNGYELAKEIAKIDPNLTYLFMSGYDADIIETQGIVTNEKNFINKPFSIEKIANKIKDILLR